MLADAEFSEIAKINQVGPCQNFGQAKMKKKPFGSPAKAKAERSAKVVTIHKDLYTR